MNICIFCSAKNLDEKYITPAKTIARFIGENGHTLVWGGSDVGLMNIIASGVEAAGGKTVGVSLEAYRGTARKSATEMIIAKDIRERKATMLLRADIIVVLIGGVGTLDEVTEILELKKHGAHSKPVIVLNTDNFYDGLIQQFERMRTDGFLFQPLEKIISFADTPEEVIDYIKKSSHFSH